jgi:uncharacterized cupin superfamily protein
MPHVSLARLELEFDSSDPEGFRAGVMRCGAALGAGSTGATLYELPPGQAVCPYHYEHAEEEWVLVLSGMPSLRTPAGIEVLAPLDLAFFPRGRAGAHQLRNDSDRPASLLMFSDVVFPAVTSYPDSGKLGVYTGDPEEDLIVRRSTAVDYYDGETG